MRPKNQFYLELFAFVCLHVPNRLIVCLNIRLDKDQILYQVTERQWEQYLINEVYQKFCAHWLKIHHTEYDMTPERHKMLIAVQDRLDKAQKKRERKNAKRLKNENLLRDRNS